MKIKKIEKNLIDNLFQSRLVFSGIILCFVIIFLLLNVLTPWKGDDFKYQLNFATGERIVSVSDVWVSGWTHWRIGNGRFVVHFIDQLFLLCNTKLPFSIANTIITVVFILLIYYLAMGKKIDNSFLLIEILAIWYCSPGIGSPMLWQSGACNYLWGTTLILLAITPYTKVFTMNATCEKKVDGSKNISNDSNLKQYLIAIFIMPLCFIAGWTIEAGASMMLAYIGGILLYSIVKKAKTHFWQWTGISAGIAGFGMMILAPGQRLRQQAVEEQFGHDNPIVELIYRLFRETYYMTLWMGTLLIMFIALYVVVRQYCDTRLALWFFIVSLIGIYVMTASIGYSTRMLLTPIAFCIIAIGRLYKRLEIKQELKSSVAIVLVGLCLLMGLQQATALYKLHTGDQILNIRTEYVGGTDSAF